VAGDAGIQAYKHGVAPTYRHTGMQTTIITDMYINRSEDLQIYGERDIQPSPHNCRWTDMQTYHS